MDTMTDDASSDLKGKHELPISRIRRAMKSNDQVKMVSVHSTVLLAKAIEMFILELTLRGWMQAEQDKRRTLKRCDIARAIRNEGLFDFLSDIVPPQNSKVEEANGSQGNEFYAAYQMIHPNNIPVEGEANDAQCNEFPPAYHMFQPNKIPSQFQVQQEANEGQGNEFHSPYQMAQPDNISVQQEANNGQGNEFHPAHQLVQPINIPVQEVAADGQGNEFHPAYQMVKPDNNSVQCQFQVQAEANDGQRNEFHPTYQMGQPNNIPYQFQVEEAANGGQGNEFHPVNQMVQPNNIPASCISIQGIPAPLMLPPLIDSSPEYEYIIDGFLMGNKEGL